MNATNDIHVKHACADPLEVFRLRPFHAALVSNELYFSYVYWCVKLHLVASKVYMNLFGDIYSYKTCDFLLDPIKSYLLNLVHGHVTEFIQINYV